MSNSIHARIDQQLQQLEPKTPEYRYTPEPEKNSFDQNVQDLLGMNLQDLHIQPLDLSSVAQSLNWNNSTMVGTGTTYNYNTTLPPFSSTLNTTSSASLNITHGASGTSISVPEGGDIMIGNRGVGATLAAIEARLAILIPDPKKLERYQALKQAYEHYKMLEALCAHDDDPDTR